jgi:hypothetical protein
MTKEQIIQMIIQAYEAGYITREEAIDLIKELN